MRTKSRIQWVGSTAIAAFLVASCGISGAPGDDQEGAGTAEQALNASDGPFADKQALINYWNTTSTNGALTQIYLNGRIAFSRSGFGPAFVKQYFDCLNSDVYAVCPSGFMDT